MLCCFSKSSSESNITCTRNALFDIIFESCNQRENLGTFKSVRQPVWSWIKDHFASFSAMTDDAVFSDIFTMRIFGRLSNDLKSLFLVQQCWYHNVTFTFLYRKCQALEIFLVSIPNGCWYFYFRNWYYLFTLFTLNLAKKWKISFSPTFLPLHKKYVNITK